MTARTYWTFIALAAFAWALAMSADDPCGVPPGQTCSTDTECACMHGAEE